jgi:DNA-directed RNA polymerase specialized sigma24 family protein
VIASRVRAGRAGELRDTDERGRREAAHAHTPEVDERTDLVDKALEVLDRDRDRELLLLILRGTTVREFALSVGATEASIRKRWTRLRRRLQSWIGSRTPM